MAAILPQPGGRFPSARCPARSYGWPVPDRACSRERTKAPADGGGLREGGARSERDDVLRLRALRALGDLELHALVLVQRAVALGLDGRVVHEDVGAAAVLSDEAEALLSVEPLHRTLCHA